MKKLLLIALALWFIFWRKKESTGTTPGIPLPIKPAEPEKPAPIVTPIFSTTPEPPKEPPGFVTPNPTKPPIITPIFEKPEAPNINPGFVVPEVVLPVYNPKPSQEVETIFEAPAVLPAPVQIDEVKPIDQPQEIIFEKPEAVVAVTPELPKTQPGTPAEIAPKPQPPMENPGFVSPKIRIGTVEAHANSKTVLLPVYFEDFGKKTIGSFTLHLNLDPREFKFVAIRNYKGTEGSNLTAFHNEQYKNLAVVWWGNRDMIWNSDTMPLFEIELQPLTTGSKKITFNNPSWSKNQVTENYTEFEALLIPGAINLNIAKNV